MTDGAYLLGMEPNEVRRLERQHDVWQHQTRRAWGLAGVASGQTVVDLGSGPGFTSLELASLVGPSGRVVAVDGSSIAGDHLRSSAAARGLLNLEVITADVTDTDLAVWKPDRIFARWLFSFLPNPGAVIARAASALTIGGAIIVMDYWNYLAIRMEPDAPIFRTVFRAVYDSFAAAGGSLDVGGTVPEWFTAAGLNVTVIEPFCQVGRPGSPVWRWLADFQDLYLPTLVEKGGLTSADVEQYQQWWRHQDAQPTALLFTPPILCVVGVKHAH